MIDYEGRARSWIAQAEYDLKAAGDTLKIGNFSLVCFLAEQSAQKSLKGFLIAQKEVHMHIHAIADLLKKAVAFNGDFSAFIEQGKILDKYYLSTRYPDVLPEPLLPFEAYGEKEAQDAIAISRAIFNAVGRYIK